MPTSNQFKLLRRGGMSRSGRYVANIDVPTPNIEAYGHQPFTEQRLQALTQQLQESKWPRGTLNVYGLEGLLTALLVLPLGIQPGAWLPLIWNGSGWKIPDALQSAERYPVFVESTISFMRAIDIGLLEATPKFISVIDTLTEQCRPKTANAHQDWVHGFGLAVSQSNYLNSTPDPITRQALYAIGTGANSHSSRVPRDQVPLLALQQAVLILSRNRFSRGPLGPLHIVRDSTLTIAK